MLEKNEEKIRELSHYESGKLYKFNSSKQKLEEIENRISIFDTNSYNFHLCPPEGECQDIIDCIKDKRSKIIDFLKNNPSIEMIKGSDPSKAEDKKDIIYVITGAGKIGGRNEFKGLFKYILAKKNCIKYELNFMRFFIEDKKVNCILKAIQFDRCIGAAVNMGGICYPKSTIEEETEILKKHKEKKFNVEEFKSGKSFCFNPSVSYDSENEIAGAFIDFINECDKQF